MAGEPAAPLASGAASIVSAPRAAQGRRAPEKPSQGTPEASEDQRKATFEAVLTSLRDREEDSEQWPRDDGPAPMGVAFSVPADHIVSAIAACAAPALHDAASEPVRDDRRPEEAARSYRIDMPPLATLVPSSRACMGDGGASRGARVAAKPVAEATGAATATVVEVATFLPRETRPALDAAADGAQGPVAGQAALAAPAPKPDSKLHVVTVDIATEAEAPMRLRFRLQGRSVALRVEGGDESLLRAMAATEHALSEIVAAKGLESAPVAFVRMDEPARETASGSGAPDGSPGRRAQDERKAADHGRDRAMRTNRVDGIYDETGRADGPGGFLL